MTRLDVKICGLSTPDMVAVAARHGATHVGFVHYPKSPRHLPVDRLRALARQTPAVLKRVAVLVDPDDALVEALLDAVDIVQLHGRETPERIVAIKSRSGLEVWKAVGVRTSADIEETQLFAPIADRLLFDAKPPVDPSGAPILPGGTGLRFDWTLLSGYRGRGWGLSGGLDAENVGEAIRVARPSLVDVSSGVEDSPGRKSASRIAAFLAAVRVA